MKKHPEAPPEHIFEKQTSLDCIIEESEGTTLNNFANFQGPIENTPNPLLNETATFEQYDVIGSDNQKYVTKDTHTPEL